MPNYRNAKIYKLISWQTDAVYYGSTTLDLNVRLSCHRTKFKRWINGKSDEYCSSFKVVKFTDCAIFLVEKYPCNTRDQLEIREEFWISTNACINMQGKSNSKRKEYEKKRYRENVEKIDCPCGGKYTSKTMISHAITKRHEQWAEEYTPDEDATVVGSDSDATNTTI